MSAATLVEVPLPVLETLTQAEAARYAVLRRLGPALRHDLVVHLQALAMMSEVLAARLDKGHAVAGPGNATADAAGALPPPLDLGAQLSRLHRLARDAVSGSLQVADWLAPSDDDAVDLRQGLEENLDLVRSSLGFRGFHLQADLPETSLQVSHDRLRHLMLAALLHLSDEARSPGELRLRTRVEPDAAWLHLALEPSGQAEGAGETGDVGAGGNAQGGKGGSRGPALPSDDTGYRPLSWSDVQALAGGEPPARQLKPARIALRLPRVAANTPLQVAPR